MQKEPSSSLYVVLPLRDIVVFPGMIAPLFVGREKSINALNNAIEQQSQIILLTQKEAEKDDPGASHLYHTGTIATIVQLLKLPDGTVKVLVEAQERVKVLEFLPHTEYLQAFVETLDGEEDGADLVEQEALTRSVLEQFEQYSKLNPKITSEILASVLETKDIHKICSHLPLKIAQKQGLLEVGNKNKQLETLYSLIMGEINVLNTEKKIRSRVKTQMEKTQKEYYLNEQLKAIHKELGDNEGKDELTEIEEKIKKVKLSTEAKEKAQAELKKLRMMSPMSAESSVIRNYLDWLLDIPWKKYKKVNKDIKKAEKTLDADHYGLEKVKERILEYLAVQQRSDKLKGPILCLVGPPGVGKTSLARSIADATGREFIRISLGGVRDEAEIRGHRRTYVGSMPGKIIQSMKKAKTSNPLFLLDEIDKMGVDFRGDPASALLEVLDPAQNNTFSDHYLEVDYDLSNVLFLATANTMNMPRPLMDRMEVIRLSGYTEDEKILIAKRHLLSRQMKEHGLKKKEWSVSDGAIRSLIRYYTREAGVRNLERELATLARKSLKDILMKDAIKSVAVTTRNLAKYAGVHRFTFGATEDEDILGVTTGLAYTEVGGDLLSIEAVCLPGKGNIKTTGTLGDVMQESAQAAFSYVRSRSFEFGITPPMYQKKDIHIHVPEGATPKDGPSAGIAMCTSIVSALTSIPVKKSVAMTGEITLRGRVLPIGGLKEKLLAALRGGVKTVLIPKDNVKDLVDIPQNVKKNMEIIPVESASEVLELALVSPLTAVEWEEEIDSVTPLSVQDNADEIVTH